MIIILKLHLSINVGCYKIFISNYLYILVKLKSIEEVENLTNQANLENKWLEKQIDDTKSRIIEVRDNIVRYTCLYNMYVHYYKFNIRMGHCVNNSMGTSALQKT